MSTITHTFAEMFQLSNEY